MDSTKEIAPEALIPEQNIVGLQHQQIGVILLLGVDEVAVVKFQPIRGPRGAAFGAILGPRASLCVLCALLSVARAVGEGTT